jgi:hypothetical protein
MSTIQDQLTFLEHEIAKLGPGTSPDHLNRIDAELSKIEKVIAKQDEEDDFDPDDSDDNGNGGADDDDDGDGVDSDRHRTRKAYSGGDDDEDEDGDGDDVPNPGRRRLFNQGQPQHYQDLEKSSHLPTHHKFETVTQRIASDRDVPLTHAAQLARKENPELFADYQRSGLVGNAAASHQALVTAAMAKGDNRVVAEQKALHALGAPPFGLQKRDTPAVRLERLMSKYMAHHDVERTEAWRAMRKRYPKLMAKLNMMEV